ncbi:MAG: hypothetical protein P8107_05440, partial [Spirochaetia bacterium]
FCCRIIHEHVLLFVNIFSDKLFYRRICSFSISSTTFDYNSDFNEIGVLENKDLLLIKVKEKCENSRGEISYCDSTRGIEMGEWDGHPEITLYWYYVTAPETNITAEFIRCD